ncbi:SDR family oxidoreductase [Rhizobium sp. TRM95796]|uniref:SDR family oxidoreductase n=1 Tax=Rhizobium sp. TRM95796 TaxID=2979862 RepID=UPI0021E8AB88|nr:SDR family oxidoreductase [Rhizobium sp. TRM95796]MCV3767728.1 SDR family oxidoreductase [Rhizobium sp. TRM95796]
MLDLFRLDGALAVVTGSSQGIGLALAKGLAAYGARVVINGRGAGKVAQAVESLRRDGYEAHGRVFDAASPVVASAIDAIEAELGPIDILVNNAGMQFRAPLADFPSDKWEELLKTNISSVFYTSQATARHMIARGRGKIINIGSVQSELGRPSIAPYTATKGAVKNLTRGMCADWARHGLQINGIGPGYFKTPLNQALVDDPDFTGWLEKRTPAGRWGDVEELIGAAVFLASPASSFVNGHMLYVDGGITTCL